MELSALDIATISRGLLSRDNRSTSDLTAGSGSLVPFMIVFHDLPDSFDEYRAQPSLLIAAGPGSW